MKTLRTLISVVSAILLTMLLLLVAGCTDRNSHYRSERAVRNVSTNIVSRISLDNAQRKGDTIKWTVGSTYHTFVVMDDQQVIHHIK